MGGMMTKEEVIQVTIGVLSEISVPVRYKEEITDKVAGCVRNLSLVLEMIAREKDAAKDEIVAVVPEGQEEAGEVNGDEPEADAE